MNREYRVVVKTDLINLPRGHELSAALILAKHFKTDVIFLRPKHKKSPDISVRGIMWEIKSPKGNSKKTIENNLRTARKQSNNIVIDLARSKMHSSRAIARAKFYTRTNRGAIRHLKIITKTQRVIDVM